MIDTSGDNPRLKYVFDVADTGGRENSRRLNLWEYRDEHHDTVTADLEHRFGVSGEKGFADQMEQIASKLVSEYWNDNRRDILGILADSFLEEYDDYNVEVAFRSAATVSTTYMLMSRCGMNPGDYFEHEDFLSVFDFNTRDTVAVLGSAISNNSEQILRQIAISVKNYEREASLQQQAERTNHGKDIELHEERGLSDSQHRTEPERDEVPRQVRQELVTKYNELFNSNRSREYDGSHIVFSGMNPEIQLREHHLMPLHTFSTAGTPCSHTKLVWTKLLKWWRLLWKVSVLAYAKSSSLSYRTT